MKRELPDTRRFLDSKETAEHSVNLFWVNDRSVDSWDFKSTRRREQVSTIGSPALPEGVRRSVVLGIIDMGDDHRCTGYAGISGLFSGDSRLQALFIPIASGKAFEFQSGFAENAHAIIERFSFSCSSFSSCPSCASMFNQSSFAIALPVGGVAARAVKPPGQKPTVRLV